MITLNCVPSLVSNLFDTPNIQSVPEFAYQPLTTSSPLSSDENFTRNIFLKSIVYKLQQFYVSQS
jgi:hypothetical protein